MNPLELIQSDDIETVQLAVNILKNEGKTVKELNEILKTTIYEIEISTNGRLMITENWDRSIRKTIEKSMEKIKKEELKLMFSELNKKK